MLTRLSIATLALFGLTASASAISVQVTIESLSPAGGTVLTPIWVGFHDGSFDSYNGNLTSQEGLERVAEDGDTARLSEDFLQGETYVQGGVSGEFGGAQDGAERVDGTLGPPLAPGSVNSQVFTIDTDGSNTYFSYASMVLPSNDFFVANGNPFAHDLSSLFTNGGSISFNIGQAGTVNDAGTEAEDFNTAAPPLGGLNMFFPAAGFGGDAGQSMGNEGAADPNNLIRNVIGDPYAGFANNNGFDLSLLNFNNLSNYPNGIARITITAVPEPATIGVLAVGMVGLVARRCR